MAMCIIYTGDISSSNVDWLSDFSDDVDAM